MTDDVTLTVEHRAAPAMPAVTLELAQRRACDFAASRGTRLCIHIFDMCIPTLYIIGMIKSFLHKGLKELLETRRTAKIKADLQKRAHVRLSALDHATSLRELNQPGFDFHPLKGKPQRYSIHVNGPWAITFEWENGAAVRVNLEQYH